MLIRLEGEAIEAAVERVRKRGGDRDWKAAVTRLVLEDDKAHAPTGCTHPTPAGTCGAPCAMGTRLCFGHHAVNLAPKRARKGAK